jgi:hypothetical protein
VGQAATLQRKIKKQKYKSKFKEQIRATTWDCPDEGGYNLLIDYTYGTG